MRKLIGLLVIVLAIAGSLALTGHKTFRAEAVIDAPAERVWEVLTDPASYAAWNPVFVEVAGTFAPGQSVTTTVLFPDGERMALDGQVAAMTEPHEIRQSGGLPGVLSFDHTWRLEPADGGTRVIQFEENHGIVVWFWDSSWVAPAYQRAVEGLKSFIESNS